MAGGGGTGRGIPLETSGGCGTGSGSLSALQMTRSLLPVADRRCGLYIHIHTCMSVVYRKFGYLCVNFIYAYYARHLRLAYFLFAEISTCPDEHGQ